MKFIYVFLSLLVSNIVYAHQTVRDDAHIRQIIIQKYIQSYPGQCACPYSLSANGKQCNFKSDYQYRKNAYCYPQDVPASKIKAFKEINGLHKH